MMDKIRSYHWRVFNVLARIAGGGFLFGGVVFILWGSSLIRDKNATIDVNGVPTRDPWEKVSVLAVGIVTSLLGALLLKARRYRPDLGDSAFTRRQKAQIEKNQFP
jgi:hypothetical protein